MRHQLGEHLLCCFPDFTGITQLVKKLLRKGSTGNIRTTRRTAQLVPDICQINLFSVHFLFSAASRPISAKVQLTYFSRLLKFKHKWKKVLMKAKMQTKDKLKATKSHYNATFTNVSTKTTRKSIEVTKSTSK